MDRNEGFAPKGQWIWHPDFPAGKPGFLLFRRNFELPAPARLRLRLSADNRYTLYLDGQRVGRGPCRSDLSHYRYEFYDLPLEAGRHALAAEVVVYPVGFRREEGPWSEMHVGGGFWADGCVGDIDLSTTGYAPGQRPNQASGHAPGTWRCVEDGSRRHRAWREQYADPERAPTPAPPTEAVDFRRAPGDWRTVDFDDNAWLVPKSVGRACLAGHSDGDPPSRWRLAPRVIPAMEETPTTPAGLLYSDYPGLRLDPDGVLRGTVGAGRGRALLDLGRNQTSMVHFAANVPEGGRGRCRLAYAESLLVDGARGERHPRADGRVGDDAPADWLEGGGGRWDFDSFWLRAGRFVELEFELDAPLSLEGFRVDFVAYPLVLRAGLRTKEAPWLERMFEVGWHTARCCAHEHYEDCPFWEQLQYAGDTRVQALISYAASGDGRLGRQAIEQFDASRVPEGLTQSRYPTNYPQIIPLFSLFWVLMIEDHYRYFADDGLVRSVLPGARAVLEWFERRRAADTGLVGAVGHWNFADWAEGWPSGRCDRGEPGPETLVNLVYADACRAYAALERAAFSAATPGGAGEAGLWRERRERVLAAVNRHCLDGDGVVYRDVPGRRLFSQHTNVWAVLSNAAPRARWDDLADAVTTRRDLSGCSLYFSFYLLEMLRRAGRDRDFEAVLGRWRAMLDWGFSTFPEVPRLNTRSECHAWSAGPVYHAIRHFLGVYPATPGFGVVGVAPRPGSFAEFSGEAPAGAGRILRVAWRNDENGFALRLGSDAPAMASVTLPGDEAPREVFLTPGREVSLTRPRAPEVLAVVG